MMENLDSSIMVRFQYLQGTIRRTIIRNNDFQFYIFIL